MAGEKDRTEEIEQLKRQELFGGNFRNVSHELKTLPSTSRGYIHTLEGGINDPKSTCTICNAPANQRIVCV